MPNYYFSLFDKHFEYSMKYFKHLIIRVFVKFVFQISFMLHNALIKHLIFDINVLNKLNLDYHNSARNGEPSTPPLILTSAPCSTRYLAI